LIESHPTVYNNKYFQGFCGVINPKSPSLGAFSVIPPEILLKIFGYLTLKELGFAVACTCKYWQRLGEDDQLWKEYTLRTFTLNHPLAQETWKLQFKDCKSKPQAPGPAAGHGAPGPAAGPKVNLTPLQMRQEALDEIVVTEREYVSALDTAISVSFLSPFSVLH